MDKTPDRLRIEHALEGARRTGTHGIEVRVAPHPETDGTRVDLVPVGTGSRDTCTAEERVQFVRDLEDPAGEEKEPQHEHARTWTDPRAPTEVVKDFEDAARFVTPAVFVRSANGQVYVFVRHDFFDGLQHVDHYADYVLAVVHGNGKGRKTPPDVVHPSHDTCRHGRTFSTGLAHTTSTDGTLWSVRAVVTEPDEAYLRSAKVERLLDDAADQGTTEGIPGLAQWTKDLREASWRTLYEAMDRDPDSSPRFADRERASVWGLHLSLPAAKLKPWRATGGETRPPREAVLVDEELDTVQVQLLERALEHEAPEAPLARDELMEPCPALEGYDWYDRLPRLTDVQVQIADEERQWSRTLEPVDATCQREAIPVRPEAVRLVLTLRHPAEKASGRPTIAYRYIETDLAFMNRPGAWANDCVPIVSKGSQLTATALAARIEEASLLDRSDRDRTRRFRADALEVATSVLEYEPKDKLAVRAQAAAQEALKTLVTEYGYDLTVQIGPGKEAQVVVEENTPTERGVEP